MIHPQIGRLEGHRPPAAATPETSATPVADAKEPREAADTPSQLEVEAPATPVIDREALEKLVEELNLQVPDQRDIHFEVGDNDGDLVVQVVDQGSEEVIRTIPPERLSGLRSYFQDLSGALLDNQA